MPGRLRTFFLRFFLLAGIFFAACFTAIRPLKAQTTPLLTFNNLATCKTQISVMVGAGGTPSDDELAEPVGPGCPCNYDFLNHLTGRIYEVRCDDREDIVCSRNASTPTLQADVSTVPGQKGEVSNFCLKKVGTECNTHSDCEEGNLCAEGICKKDFGEQVVGGFFGEEVSDVRDNIRLLINIALGFLGIASVLMIVYGGALWLTAGGSDDKVAKGKHTLTWAAIGALIISIAWTISSYILRVGKEL